MLLNNEKLNIVGNIYFPFLALLVLFINIFTKVPHTLEIMYMLLMGQILFNVIRALSEKEIERERLKEIHCHHAHSSNIKYFINLYEKGHGHIQTAKEAYEGELVQLSVMTADNYELEKFSFIPDVLTWDKPMIDGHFIMPDCDIEIEATFKDNRKFIERFKSYFS